jgi:hypothetical protein
MNACTLHDSFASTLIDCTRLRKQCAIQWQLLATFPDESGLLIELPMN